jgi:hypothetical protein
VSDHRAWIAVNGLSFPILSGSAEQNATRRSSSFSAQIPLGYPGAEAFFALLDTNEATVSVLTGGVTQDLMAGEIDTADFDYIGGVISVRGRCKSAKLHAQKTAEKWINKKPHEIVQDLAGRVGLNVEIDQSSLKAGRFIQIDWSKMTDNVSYMTVVHKMAEFMGARWWVDAKGVLYVKSTDNPQGVYTLNYSNGPPKSANFLSLRICRNIQAGKPCTVTVKSFHPGQKKTFAGTFSIGGAGESVEYAYHLPGHSQDHADQHARTKAKEHTRHELQLSATLPGDPLIDVAMKLQLAGTMFAQGFDMDSIHHQFGYGGHTMSISARSAKEGRS